MEFVARPNPWRRRMWSDHDRTGWLRGDSAAIRQGGTHAAGGRHRARLRQDDGGPRPGRLCHVPGAGNHLLRRHEGPSRQAGGGRRLEALLRRTGSAVLVEAGDRRGTGFGNACAELGAGVRSDRASTSRRSRPSGVWKRRACGASCSTRATTSAIARRRRSHAHEKQWNQRPGSGRHNRCIRTTSRRNVHDDCSPPHCLPRCIGPVCRLRCKCRCAKRQDHAAGLARRRTLLARPRDGLRGPDRRAHPLRRGSIGDRFRRPAARHVARGAAIARAWRPHRRHQAQGAGGGHLRQSRARLGGTQFDHRRDRGRQERRAHHDRRWRTSSPARSRHPGQADAQLPADRRRSHRAVRRSLCLAAAQLGGTRTVKTAQCGARGRDHGRHGGARQHGAALAC